MNNKLIFPWIVVTGILWALAGCSSPGPRSPSEAISVSHALFKNQEHALIWVPGSPGIAGSMASSIVGNAGLDSPTVAGIYRAISPAANTSVRVAISGRDSRFAAKATLSALNQIQGSLPNLSLAFVGDQADAEEIRTVVKTKGGSFLFAPTTASMAK